MTAINTSSLSVGRHTAEPQKAIVSVGFCRFVACKNLKNDVTKLKILLLTLVGTQ
jgi:hypothetical protein